MRPADFVALVLLCLGVAGHAVVANGFLPLGALLGPIYLGVGVLVGGLSGLFLAFHAFGGLPAAMASGLTFEASYPVAAWRCRVPDLVVAELVFNRRSA